MSKFFIDRPIVAMVMEIIVTLVIAIVLVILVVFPLFGFSINTLSMFGLVLAIGLVVDDAIVQIGLVMLIGLAAKNAILIVEFAKEEYEKGKPLVDAALQGAKLRLRPILMTSFAFILGCVPLWIATGAGSVARQIMGTTVIGGMVAATGIAIFIIPALFVLVERFATRPGGAHSPAVPQPTPSEAD